MIYTITFNPGLDYVVKINDLKPIQIYKIMVHFLGPLGIDIKTKLICDDIHEINKKKQNIRLNDYSEYDFWTNEKGVPKIWNSCCIFTMSEKYTQSDNPTVKTRLWIYLLPLILPSCAPSVHCLAGETLFLRKFP